LQLISLLGIFKSFAAEQEHIIDFSLWHISDDDLEEVQKL